MAKRVFIIKIEAVNGYLGESPESEIKDFVERLSKHYTEDDVNPVYVQVIEL